MTFINYKLVIAYDGKAYKGWQKTQEGPSIEETLQKALEQILQHPICLQAASRTDKGVHAEGQVVNFFTNHPCLDLSRLYISLNQLLPDDITVLSCEEVSETFHPTLDAKGKIYHYYVCNSHFQLPHHRNYSWHCYKPLDLSLMQNAVDQLTGIHDYSAFCNKKSEHVRDSFECCVDMINISTITPQRFRFEIQGRNFLYQMVRNLVGTLVYVGYGKISFSNVSTILASKDRALAGVSAPPHGLFLHRVLY